MKNILIYIALLFINGILFAQQDAYNSTLDLYYAKADEHFYQQKDSAYFYYNKAFNLAKKENAYIDMVEAIMSSNYVANYYFELDRYKLNIDVLDSLFLNKPLTFNTEKEAIFSTVYYNYEKGNYLYVIEKYKQARQYFKNVINFTTTLPNESRTDDVVNYELVANSFIAKMYFLEGKFNLAKQYYEQNIRFLKSANQDPVTLGKNYILLAEVYRNEKKYVVANNYLIKALKYNLASNDAVLPLLNIVQNHTQLAQIDSASFYLTRAKKYVLKDDPKAYSYYQVSAELAQKKGEYKTALNEFQQALQLTKEKWKNLNNWETAHVLNKIGLLHAHFKNTTEAIEAYDLALENLLNSNFEVDNRTLLKVLKNKAQALTELERYNTCIATVDLGIQKLDALKPTFESQEDKLLLIENAYPLFETGLASLYELQKETEEDTYIDTAFNYLEKSKSTLLLETLLSAQATEFGVIPKELLAKETHLKLEISHLKNEINKSSGAANDLKDQLFSLTTEYNLFIKNLEQHYKTYYNLKYNTATTTLQKAQELLANDEILVSYFYGENAIYAIALQKTSKQIHKIEVTKNLDQQIKKALQMLANPSSNEQELANITFQLYNALLKPVLPNGVKNKLVIVPDGLLNYLPFDALNTQKNNIHYIVNDYAVSTLNSVSILDQLQQPNAHENKVVAFAPVFAGEAIVGKEERTGLTPLPNNKKEVLSILSFFKGISYIDKQANLNNFVTDVAKGNIVHLATHAVFNDVTPEYSYLAFTPQDSTENLLYVNDIYNLKTNADLVTLSACETGVGELKKGEGAIGISHAFFYAGAKSLVSTLWNVLDNSAAQIMKDFYQNLANNSYKNVALQKAKLQYLERYKETPLSHPYYWSSITVQGNMAPLTGTKLNWWLIIMGLFALMILFWRKRLFQFFK